MGEVCCRGRWWGSGEREVAMASGANVFRGIESFRLSMMQQQHKL